jgi:Flp pilus assembly protein TadB
MWPAIAAVVGALVAAASTVAVNEREPKNFKALRRVVEIREKVDDATLKRELTDLGLAYTRELAAGQSRKASTNPINKTNVTLTIILIAVALGVGWLVWLWATGDSKSGFAWLAYTCLALWSVASVLFIAASFATWRNPPSPSKPKKK